MQLYYSLIWLVILCFFCGWFFFASECFAIEPYPDEVEAANLNELEPPYILICTKAPEAIDTFKCFLKNRATFLESINNEVKGPIKLCYLSNQPITISATCLTSANFSKVKQKLLICL